jgi:hypothetical protein
LLPRRCIRNVQRQLIGPSQAHRSGSVLEQPGVAVRADVEGRSRDHRSPEVDADAGSGSVVAFGQQASDIAAMGKSGKPVDVFRHSNHGVSLSLHALML